MLRHPYILGDPQTKGDKIRSGYLTTALSGAQKKAKVLRHPCILGGPQRQVRGKNQKWPTGGHIAYMHAFLVKWAIVFFFWLTPEVQRVLKTVLGKVGVSSI